VVLGVAIYTIHTSKASSQRLEQKSKIDTIGYNDDGGDDYDDYNHGNGDDHNTGDW